MTFSEALLVIIAGAAVVAAITLVILVGRVARASSEIERLAVDVQQMLPKIERILDSADREFGRFEQVADRVERIAIDFEVVTSKASKAFVPALDLVANLVKPARFVNAALTGFNVGLSVLRRMKGSQEGSDSEANQGAPTDGGDAPKPR